MIPPYFVLSPQLVEQMNRTNARSVFRLASTDPAPTGADRSAIDDEEDEP